MEDKFENPIKQDSGEKLPETQQKYVSNRRERIYNFLKLTGIYGELIEECFDFLTQEPIDPFTDYEEAQRENPNLTVHEYIDQLVSKYDIKLKEIISNKLKENNLEILEQNNKLLVNKIRSPKSIIHDVMNQLMSINIYSVLAQRSKKGLISKIKNILNLEAEIQPEITIYPTHIEVCIPMTSQEFSTKFDCSAFVASTYYASTYYLLPIMVYPNTESSDSLEEIKKHEIQHIKQKITRFMVEWTSTITESPYQSIIDELAAFVYQKFAARKNNLVEELENLRIGFVLFKLDYYLNDYLKRHNSNKLTESEISKMTEETRIFFDNLIFVTRLLKDTPYSDKYISYVMKYLNNLDGLFVNPKTFYIFPLRILQSIDPIIGELEIKFIRKKLYKLSQSDFLVLRVRSIKKSLQKEQTKRTPLLSEYLNLIKLEIQKTLELIGEFITNYTRNREAIQKALAKKEELIKALKDIEEIENSL